MLDEEFACRSDGDMDVDRADTNVFEFGFLAFVAVASCGVLSWLWRYGAAYTLYHQGFEVD